MQSYFAKGRLVRLCMKELRESLRDRRTLITLILMPILVYPLLSMVMQRLVVGVGTPPKSAMNEYNIGVADDQTAGIVSEALAQTSLAIRNGLRHSIEIRRPNSPSSEAIFSIVVADNGRVPLQKVLEDGEIDLAVTQASLERIPMVSGGVTGGISPAFQFQVEFRDADPRSEGAMLEFRKAMELVNEFQASAFRGKVIPPSVRLVSDAIGQKRDATASLAGILPLILILMTITGAVYPAIDLTAGERERGTMEAMIATPAPRFLLLLSKYVAVVTVAVLTALANLFASWITLSVGGLGRALLGERGFSIAALFQILPLLAIFAAFFSAILLAMCSFARSFKEAQAYLIPVMLVSLAPALVTLMPNIQFSTLLGIVPLVNILLLSREIMIGSPAPLPAFAAVFSTLLYAAAALVVASRLFGAESSTAGSQETWSDLVRRPKRLRDLPDLGELALYLSLLFPIFFVATNLFGQMQIGMEQKLWVNAALLLVLFFIIPCLFVWHRRLVFEKTFLSRGWLSDSIHGGSTAITKVWRGIGVFVAVGLLASGLWILAYEMLKLLSDLGFAAISLDRSQALEEAKAEFAKIPFWILFVTSALIPAIAEEFFFRGFVLSAFRSRFAGLRAVLYTALLFGIFHVINGSILSLERFAPTFLLGLFLGMVALRTHSIWPGCLLHAIHNGLLFWLTRFSEKELGEWLGSGNEHFPLVWILGSMVAVTLGTWSLLVSTSKRTDENNY